MRLFTVRPKTKTPDLFLMFQAWPLPWVGVTLFFAWSTNMVNAQFTFLDMSPSHTASAQPQSRERRLLLWKEKKKRKEGCLKPFWGLISQNSSGPNQVSKDSVALKLLLNYTILQVTLPAASHRALVYSLLLLIFLEDIAWWVSVLVYLHLSLDR